ncbi:hypothetical protein ROJ8625_02643 [Roseivivax jejudonensis]|uniref:DUF4168 domain-containing protein n=1 Tax=Roseivivax jejudonensis TaxID=1529041 RepID=A0A1X6ZKV8_9RHOB|nr:DUF4168 domain-containing protein [Roseivivax jejudonensis]SLN52426.1 hypothetical protein ROJ8625_02643 [Roseivivax jejudonensis]
MFPTRKITAATLAAAIAAAPASFALAQDASGDMETQTQPQTEMEQSQDAAPETPVFEDAQIDAFASAVIEVTEIRDQYATELQGVEDETAQQELIDEANAEMRSAIEATDGLTMDDYMAINRAASMDEDLNQRIAQRLEEMQTEDAG